MPLSLVSLDRSMKSDQVLSFDHLHVCRWFSSVGFNRWWSRVHSGALAPPILRLWSRALGSDQKTKIVDTSSGNCFFWRAPGFLLGDGMNSSVISRDKEWTRYSSTAETRMAFGHLLGEMFQASKDLGWPKKHWKDEISLLAEGDLGLSA